MLTAQYGLKDLLLNVDLNTPQTSSVYMIKTIEGFFVQHSWTAGSARSVSVIVGVSGYETGPFSPIDSYTIDSTAGDRLINVEFARYNYVQIKTTVQAAGGGTLTSTIGTKTF